MKIATTVAQWVVRITGAIQIVLGALFWTGNAPNLVQAHMLSGIALVLALWVLALLAGRAGIPGGFVVLAFAWGLVVVLFGLNQARILPGPLHWIVQTIHLLLGLGAIGLAEHLARRTKAALPRARTGSSLAGEVAS